MRSLTPKLILAFLVVSLTGALLVAFFAGQTTAREFGNFMFAQNQEYLVGGLSRYYELNGEWTGINELIAQMQNRRSDRGRNNDRRSEKDGPPIFWDGPRLLLRTESYFALADESGKIVIPGLGYEIGEPVSQARLSTGVPIEVGGEVVGKLLLMRTTFAASKAEDAFLRSVNSALIFAAVGATAIALFLGVFLARTLTRPLRELTTATKAVAKGELEQQVPVRSQDELGQLAASFNQMSADLANARDLRRQMTADIAHDLRTPLSIILGHAEALHDGILPPTSDTFYIIHDEALRLQRLVEDLRTLSLAEAGELPLHPDLISPQTLLEKASAAHTPRAQEKEIDLQVQTEPNLPHINVDPDRMRQVLGNLLSNALRYTPNGGTITLSAKAMLDTIQISVQDTGPGIAPQELSHIFERFYRADKSRKRHDGGSGLGLAIAKGIVQGHKGQIWAESKLGEGVKFVIALPV